MVDAVSLLSAGLEFFFAVVSIILIIGCLLDYDIKRFENRAMIAILISHALMNVADALIWLWCDTPDMLAIVKALTFIAYGLGYTNCAIFAYLSAYYIGKHAHVTKLVYRYISAWSVIAALMLFLSMFNGMYYYWDEYGICKQGELHILSQAFGVAIFAFIIVLALVYRKALSRRDFVALVLYCAIPLSSYAFTPLWDVVPLYMASTISLLLYYTVVHTEYGWRVAEHKEQLARQELALNNSRTAMMLTQIQPHFLYNSLTAIAQLCEIDPKQAKETTLNFSEYLRQNMNSLEQKEPIAFESELAHVKTYLAIEKVRFGENLRIVYDIGTIDFSIPSLCLQPIVENAVKHGVSAREGGGTVIIRTRELSDSFEITVLDDGVGFDDAHKDECGDRHIGIRNVRQRLEAMIGATLNVESQIGAGTKATIRIYKKERLA